MSKEKIAQLVLFGAFAASALGLAFALGFVINDDSGGGAPAIADAGSSDAVVTSSDGPFDVLNDIYSVLAEDFVESDRVDDDVDVQLLVEGAINGLLSSLGDPHTVYIDPEGFRSGRADSSGSFEGIGAHVRPDTESGRIVIVTPFTGSPAERAGIRAGDIITSVDGESTDGWSIEEAVTRIRGERGSTVEVGVLHTDGNEEVLAIERAEIVVETVWACPSVPLESREDSADIGLGVPCPLVDQSGDPVTDIGYIRIEQFTQFTATDVEAALKGFAGQDLRGIVIDLRGNPGGLLGATVDTVDLFVDEQIVLTQEEGDGTRTDYRARDGKETDLPLVVLMDGSSASGAEVLAAALGETDRATLIGANTFGKGTVNRAQPLPDGGAIYVSIARWLTPNGNQIEGQGVTPDIPMELTDADFDRAAQDPNYDPYLFRALDLLRSGG